MQFMRGISDVNQCCLNLRWLVRQRCPDPTRWGMELGKITRNYLGYNRALGLLMGADPNPDEIRMLAEVFKVEPEELVAVPLYTRESTILQLNLTYLAEVIPHGQKDKMAKVIGVTPPQISRWASGEVKPHKKNLRLLLKLHGIDPDLDLTKIPLFLSLDPLSGFDQRSWIASRVQDLPAAEIAKIYPALRKLLRYDD
jgi:transcriptional regulator with XRE-family HTH domain